MAHMLPTTFPGKLGGDRAGLAFDANDNAPAAVRAAERDFIIAGGRAVGQHDHLGGGAFLTGAVAGVDRLASGEARADVLGELLLGDEVRQGRRLVERLDLERAAVFAERELVTSS